MTASQKILYLTFILCSGITSLQGQDFLLNQDAIQISDSCYQLTGTTFNSAGSIWNPDKIDLNNSFDVVMDIFLGCKDEDGADGIVFAFQPLSTSVGGSGGGMGYANVTPSIAIEFDTYQNFENGDPAFDHLAILRNGSLDHDNPSTNLSGPIQANATQGNIEDCEWHELRVTWDADLTKLDVYFDCEFRATYTGDIVNEIFSGDPNVFWGFTSATGSLNNIQQVCLTYTTFLDELEDLVLCPNGEVQLTASGGVSYEWTPAAGLSNSTIPNPVAAPAETTTYTVAIFDDCGLATYDSVQITVDGDSSFVELGLDTFICQGETLVLDATNPNTTYQWSTGNTESSIEVTLPGIYVVTVTVDQYCFDTDRIALNVIPNPVANLLQPLPPCEGVELVLDADFGDPDATYQWQNGSSESTLSVLTEGSYAVTVENVCGKASSSVDITFESCREVYIPNAFTPNFDGINDYFYLQDEGDVEEITFLRVFDRWGNLVYETTNSLPNDGVSGWDGTFRGGLAESGVYAWACEVRYRDGFQEVLSGSLHLIR
ncbi:MAG: gliding motility-associated C-terminal domain-containing protein [Bacteroidota bacterium]